MRASVPFERSERCVGVRRPSFAIALLLAAATARAAEGPLPEALAKYDAGQYEAVVDQLARVFGSREIVDPIDRAQALRIYGIACVLTGRGLAAESAFVEWLGLEPRARLDARLVRPDVVAFFEQVKARHRDELLREVERRRPRTAALNLLPPAGQFQNGQRAKFGVLLGLEVALLATNVATGVALYSTVDAHGVFPDADRATQLKVVNWVSFGALIATVLYGVIDGFVVFNRIRDAINRDADGLRAGSSNLALNF
jgi:hypothetical protein